MSKSSKSPSISQSFQQEVDENSEGEGEDSSSSKLDSSSKKASIQSEQIKDDDCIQEKSQSLKEPSEHPEEQDLDDNQSCSKNKSEVNSN